MIEITPAILTNDLESFKTQINRLSGFHTVDIDIIRPPYVDNLTVQAEQILPILEKSDIEIISFHIMANDPLKDLEKIKSSGIKKSRIYLQQEVDLSFLSSFAWPQQWIKGISIEIETPLKSLDFYNQFAEVQLMSIQIGRQGNKFDESVLSKIAKLKSIGYNGWVSLDGGINLETAKIIKSKLINRVSVGSYFAKSTDIQQSFKELNAILNS